MMANVIKRTIEEVTDASGSVTETVKAVEIALMEDGVEKGRINVNEWGANTSIYEGGINVQEVADALVALLAPPEEQ